MKTREIDLFGEVQWDEKAFPREWVERMKGLIRRRQLEKIVDDAHEQRMKTGVFPADLPYEKWVAYTKFLRANPDWTP